MVAKNVTVGQSVAASLQAPNLFTIAQDLKRMQVYAKTDESDTGFIKVGGDATFQVDAFPNETFHGQVSAIRLNAYVVQNVVTYDTVIDFENPDERLLPGETAYVTIPTGHAENVLEIPNAALTYTPDLPAADLDRLYRRFGIPEAARTSHTRRPAGRLEARRAAASSSRSRSRPGSPISPTPSSSQGNLKEGDLLVTGAMTRAPRGTGKGKPRRPPGQGNAGRPR